MMETKTIKPVAAQINPTDYAIAVAAKKKKTAGEEESPELMVVPERMDVLLGRGRTNFWHEGNVRFREIIGSHLQEYLTSVSRSQKSRVVRKIADAVLVGARCLKQSPKSPFHWYNAGVKAAREKIGHALRDASADKSRGIKKIHLDLQAKKAEEKRRKKVSKCIEREKQKISEDPLMYGIGESIGDAATRAERLNTAAEILVGALAMSSLPGMNVRPASMSMPVSIPVNIPVNVPDVQISAPRLAPEAPSLANRSLGISGRMYTNPSRTLAPLMAAPRGLAALESAIRLQEANMNTSYANSSETEDSLGRASSTSSSTPTRQSPLKAQYKAKPLPRAKAQVKRLYTQPPAITKIQRTPFRKRRYPMNIKSGSKVVVPTHLSVHQRLAVCHPIREFSFATRMGRKGGNPFQTRTLHR